MDIIHVCRRFVKEEWGGTETVILETSKELMHMGHKSEIFCSTALAQSQEEWFGSIRVARYPYFYPYIGLSSEARQKLDKKGGNLFSFAIWKALRQCSRPDLLHLHAMKRLGGIGRSVARARRIPYVVSLHGGVFDVAAQEAQTWTEPTRGTWEWGKLLGFWVGSRRVLEDANAIICVGKQEQQAVQARLPQKKVFYLPNGVRMDRFQDGHGEHFRNAHHISRQTCVIGMVGRIDPQKNQMLAISLMKELESRHDVHLVLIGPPTNPDYYAQLHDRIEQSGLKTKVTIIPGLPPDSQELKDAYHAADIFLLPSVHEPFGIVILEAWTAGLPVIASNVGGIPTFVETGKDGILCESGNLKGFKDALVSLIENPERRKSLAHAGFEKANHEYGWEKITQRLVKIYEETIRENPLRE